MTAGTGERATRAVTRVASVTSSDSAYPPPKLRFSNVVT